MNIGNKIASLRKEKNLSQEQFLLASIIGLITHLNYLKNKKYVK